MSKAEFIKQFARYVQKHAPKYNVLVCSPIIAQGIIESNYGTSNKVKVTLPDGTIEWRHNYLGLKWRDGRCQISNEYFVEGTSEQNPDGSYRNIKDAFMKFNSMEECVIGYFEWTGISKYANTRGVSDPRTYVENIKADGYATSLTYVDTIMNKINELNLTQYDTIGGNTMTNKTVCIDAGHVGDDYNKCPTIPAYAESAVMWKHHLLQKKCLEQLGINVIITRQHQNVDMALDARGKMSKGCDLFISNHSNAVAGGMNEGTDYVAVYHLTDDTTTYCDDASKDIASKIAPVIAEVMGTNQGYKVLTRKSANDRNGDGILNDNYYGVLNGARSVGTPALILEHSFHTNTRTVNWLLDDGNLDRLARAEAEVIANYLIGDVADVEEPSTPVPDKLYRVQIGAYTKYNNAETQRAIIASAGYNAIIVTVGKYYKVQVGAFQSKDRAEALKNEIRSKGFSAIVASNGIAVDVDTFEPYKVRITASVLKVRSGAGVDYPKVTSVPKGGVYTIVEESGGWGRLKSGAGWISLAYTAKLA